MRDIAVTSVEPKMTVAYLRTATTDRRAIGPSPERQRRVCEQYARALGLRLSMIYADVGVSGLSERRPALNQLMLDLGRGRIRCVVIAAPYRLARSQELEQRLWKRIRRHGASLTMPCDSRQLPTRKEDI
jgi:DNA invertase Pin-like site-specific DNA recombinase